MIFRKGPAFAGLFFALNLAGSPPSAGNLKLNADAQLKFRSFVEAFIPLVLRLESKGANYRWHASNRDCAGLVRYVFWEALQQHDDRFFDRYPAMRSVNALARSQLLAQIASAWQTGNQTADQLIQHSRRVARDARPARLKTGDLLYFYSAELKIRHVMLIVRTGAGVLAVYHTGDARAELRIRTLPDLEALPESQWHPDAQNPVFQGVFRPQFLD
jgi:uncharacterized protein YfaT (DUF1175 family)